jgi:hypothetical protein
MVVKENYLDDSAYDLVEPRASAMVESFRAFGYNLPTAIADLVDNSITANAKNIWLTFSWNGAESYVALRDDGCGMTTQELINAMRPGSQNPSQQRDADDLGRFGLGLKTASFSQCRRLTVASRSSKSEIVIRRWDLDYVNQVDRWQLLHSAAPGSDVKLADLKDMEQGTIVLWESLDRIVGNAQVNDQKAQDDFLESVEEVEKHLGVVFHRFLERRDRLKIWINNRQIEPWDPFLSDANATQILPLEPLTLKGEIVKVQPYILPHHSKITSDRYEKAGGLNGWLAQQGFYVYRNERLLVAGNWLGLGYAKDEHSKLARIQIDLPNSMDSEWQIDIKKSRARPPASLKGELKRIARLTRYRATEIYRHRGAKLARQNSTNYSYLWEQKINHGKISYNLNLKHPMVEAILNESVDLTPRIKALLRMIESTVPIPLIVLDNAEHPCAQAQPFEGVNAEKILEVMTQVFMTLLNNGWSFEEAGKGLSNMEPFQNCEDLIDVVLEQYQKQENK